MAAIVAAFRSKNQQSMYLGFWRVDARKPAPLLEVSEKCASEVSNSGPAPRWNCQGQPSATDPALHYARFFGAAAPRRDRAGDASRRRRDGRLDRRRAPQEARASSCDGPAWLSRGLSRRAAGDRQGAHQEVLPCFRSQKEELLSIEVKLATSSLVTKLQGASRRAAFSTTSFGIANGWSHHPIPVSSL